MTAAAAAASTSAASTAAGAVDCNATGLDTAATSAAAAEVNCDTSTAAAAAEVACDTSTATAEVGGHVGKKHKKRKKFATKKAPPKWIRLGTVAQEEVTAAYTGAVNEVITATATATGSPLTKEVTTAASAVGPVFEDNEVDGSTGTGSPLAPEVDNNEVTATVTATGSPLGQEFYNEDNEVDNNDEVIATGSPLAQEEVTAAASASESVTNASHVTAAASPSQEVTAAAAASPFKEVTAAAASASQEVTAAAASASQEVTATAAAASPSQEVTAAAASPLQEVTAAAASPSPEVTAAAASPSPEVTAAAAAASASPDVTAAVAAAASASQEVTAAAASPLQSVDNPLMALATAALDCHKNDVNSVNSAPPESDSDFSDDYYRLGYDPREFYVVEDSPPPPPPRRTDSGYDPKEFDEVESTTAAAAAGYAAAGSDPKGDEVKESTAAGYPKEFDEVEPPQRSPTDFQSYEELKNYTVSQILNVGLCNSLKKQHPETYSYFWELFQRHPDKEAKRASLIVDIMIKVFPKAAHKRTLELGDYQFYIKRSDGTEDSISWVKPIHGEDYTVEKKLTSAMRHAIEDQVRLFRQQHRTKPCGSCGKRKDLSVDHINHFEELCYYFLNQQPHHPMEFSKDPITKQDCFREQDASYRNLWQDYHQKNANLQILCTECNQNRPAWECPVKRRPKRWTPARWKPLR